MNPNYQQTLNRTAQAVHGTRSQPSLDWGELSNQTQAEIDGQQQVIDVAGVSAPLPPSPPKPRPTKASTPVSPAVQQEKGQPLSEKLENFKAEALKKLAVFAFWKTAQAKTAKKGSGIGDRLKELALRIVSDLPRWIGLILPALIAVPGLRAQILILYCMAMGLLICGYLCDRKSLTHNGVIALIALKLVEEFIKTFLP